MEAPNDAKIDSCVYQFNVIAVASADVVSAADTFNSIFRNFRGTMGTTKVHTVEMNNQTQLEERDGDKLRRVINMDYTIIFDV